MRPRALGLVLALLVASCSASGQGPDAGPSDAGPLALVLGTGERAFTPITEGQTVQLARGCQGLQHVWIALRATGIAPRGVHVRLSLTRVSDGVVVSAPFDTPITFAPDPGGVYFDLTGLMLVVPTPDLALGAPLVLRGEIVDREGRGTSAMLDVMIEWGSEICG